MPAASKRRAKKSRHGRKTRTRRGFRGGGEGVDEYSTLPEADTPDILGYARYLKKNKPLIEEIKKFVKKKNQQIFWNTIYRIRDPANASCLPGTFKRGFNARLNKCNTNQTYKFKRRNGCNKLKIMEAKQNQCWTPQSTLRKSPPPQPVAQISEPFAQEKQMNDLDYRYATFGAKKDYCMSVKDFDTMAQYNGKCTKDNQFKSNNTRFCNDTEKMFQDEQSKRQNNICYKNMQGEYTYNIIGTQPTEHFFAKQPQPTKDIVATQPTEDPFAPTNIDEVFANPSTEPEKTLQPTPPQQQQSTNLLDLDFFTQPTTATGSMRPQYIPQPTPVTTPPPPQPTPVPTPPQPAPVPTQPLQRSRPDQILNHFPVTPPNLAPVRTQPAPATTNPFDYYFPNPFDTELDLNIINRINKSIRDKDTYTKCIEDKDDKQIHQMYLQKCKTMPQNELYKGQNQLACRIVQEIEKIQLEKGCNKPEPNAPFGYLNDIFKEEEERRKKKEEEERKKKEGEAEKQENQQNLNKGMIQNTVLSYRENPLVQNKPKAVSKK